MDPRGSPDLFGRALQVSITGHADEIAAAASLVMEQGAEGQRLGAFIGERRRQPHLDVQVPAHDATVDLDGRGLLLVPSAFAARPVVSDRAPWLPGVIYPARGIATLWEHAPATPGGLARLIGRSRATMLADLTAPRSTAELAQRLSLSPATASHHLSALRQAGLVTGRRDGRSVLYARTPLGDALATQATKPSRP